MDQLVIRLLSQQPANCKVPTARDDCLLYEIHVVALVYLSVSLGAVSGMVGICAGQPLDTLRVRLQQRGCQQTSTAAILRASGAKAGMKDLFRGMSYPLYTIALQVCLRLGLLVAASAGAAQ